LTLSRAYCTSSGCHASEFPWHISRIFVCWTFWSPLLCDLLLKPQHSGCDIKTSEGRDNQKKWLLVPITTEKGQSLTIRELPQVAQLFESTGYHQPVIRFHLYFWIKSKHLICNLHIQDGAKMTFF